MLISLEQQMGSISITNLISKERFGYMYMRNMSLETKYCSSEDTQTLQEGVSHSFLAEFEDIKYLWH